MKWGAYGAGVVVAVSIAAVVLAAVEAVSAKVAGGALQLLGIGLTVLGVAVVRSWLERAADKAVEAKYGLDRWWALRRTQVKDWWARRRGRPVAHSVNLSAHLSASGSLSATVTAQRRRVDRETVSDREWLAFLDDRVESVFEFMDQAERNRSTERDEVNRQLAAHRDEIRAEMLRETRQGWELIVAGLVCSAVGTAVGMAG
jgi:hypothetical protein